FEALLPSPPVEPTLPAAPATPTPAPTAIMSTKRNASSALLFTMRSACELSPGRVTGADLITTRSIVVEVVMFCSSQPQDGVVTTARLFVFALRAQVTAYPPYRLKPAGQSVVGAAYVPADR